MYKSIWRCSFIVIQRVVFAASLHISCSQMWCLHYLSTMYKVQKNREKKHWYCNSLLHLNKFHDCKNTHKTSVFWSKAIWYLCSSSLFSWCRDRGGEGSSISLRSTPGTMQQDASMPMSGPGSLSRPTARRERKPAPCSCPAAVVVVMEPCCLPLWSPMALAVPLSCWGRLMIRSESGPHLYGSCVLWEQNNLLF